MNLNDSIREASRRSGVPVDQCKLIVDTFLNVIIETLAANEPVIFRRFGTFAPSFRRGRSFVTGEVLEAGDTPTGVSFRISDTLRKALRGAH